MNIDSSEYVALKYPFGGEFSEWEKDFHNLSHEISCTLILHPNIGI